MVWYGWLIVVIPLSLILWQAIRARKYIRGAADYLAAGRVAGRYVISVGDLESALGVITIVALVEREYQCGFAVGFWGKISIPLSIIISLTGYCVYRFRETKSLSMGQFLEMRYNRAFRICAASIRTISEMICNAIGPAVAARFFIYFLGFPHNISIGGFQMPTFMLLVGFVLLLCLIIIWQGGRLSLLITDCIQGLMCYPIFVIITVFILTEFSWAAEMAPVMENRVAGESFLNPYDVQSLRDFNLFSLIVGWFSLILQRASWIGNDTSGCGRTPHEQKMAGVLGQWRNGFSTVMCALIALAVLTLMWHPDFSKEAKSIRNELSNKVAEEVIANPKLCNELEVKLAAIPEQVRVKDVDAPLSRKDNPDTAYLDETRKILAGQEGGLQLFQKFRTLYNQMMLPVALRQVFPPFLMGLLTLLMVMLMLSTDDSRVFNASSTIVQDIVMPLRRKPLTTEQHFRYLRYCTLGVVVFFFCGSLFMAQLDYISMFISITTSIWLGGAGPIMVGGLYTRFGTTTGAFSALACGSSVSVGGILFQRNWADYIYPFIEEMGWVESWDLFFRTVSGPFNPLIVWEMDAAKFPVNSVEIYFIAMIMGILGYVIGSLLTYKKPFNLDRMLHRGIYDLEGIKKAPEPWTIRSFWRKLIGITPEYTRGDKIIAWSVVIYSLGYTLGIMFFGVIIWNAFEPWPMSWWSMYFYINSIVVSLVIGIVSTFWFVPLGIRDMRQMFRDLKLRVNNPLDDGRVEGNISLADQLQFQNKEENTSSKENKGTN